MTHSPKAKAAVAAVLLMAAGGGAAQAEPDVSLCVPHDEAVAKLDHRYGERQVGIGLEQQGETVIELFVAATGTWTVLVTRTDGLSCVAAAGESWMTTPKFAGDPT